MKFAFKKGATSLILTVFIQDSSSTTGAGLGGLIETSSIVGGYVRMLSTGVALVVDENVTTEGTYQAPTTPGQVRIGTPANMRSGTYELHFHNDLFATGADTVTITLGGATNMADLPLEIQLTDFDLNDASPLVTLASETHTGAVIPTVSTLTGHTAQTADHTEAIAAIPTTSMRGTDGANTTTPPTVEAIADQVHDEDIVAAHGGADTAGRALRTLMAISDRSNNSNLNDLLGVNDAAGRDVAFEVWEEANKGSDHNNNNTTGKQLRQASGTVSGTAQAGTASTVTLPSDVTFADNTIRGSVVGIIGGTGEGQHRVITNWVLSTKIATVFPDWDVIPNSTSELELEAGRVNVDTMLLSGINALVSGRVDASVGAMAADVLTASALATDAVNEIRDAITGGGFSLDTDALGRIRIVDGTGAGELDTLAGLIAGIAGTKNTFDSLNDITAASVMTTQMTESFAADGVAPTPAQSMFLTQQMLTEFAIAGITLTMKKLDGTTTAATFTLNDGTDPTSLTRTS